LITSDDLTDILCAKSETTIVSGTEIVLAMNSGVIWDDSDLSTDLVFLNLFLFFHTPSLVANVLLISDFFFMKSSCSFFLAGELVKSLSFFLSSNFFATLSCLTSVARFFFSDSIDFFLNSFTDDISDST
jgi:hypothetical protein